MKSTLLLLLFLGNWFLVFAQIPSGNIYLNNGKLKAEANIRQGFLDSFQQRSNRFNNKSLLLLQFKDNPGEEVRKKLKSAGVEILDYVADHTFSAVASGKLSTQALTLANARSLIPLEPAMKMGEALRQGQLPPWSVKIAGTVDVWVKTVRAFSLAEILKGLQDANIDVLSANLHQQHILSLRLSVARLEQLASLPFIEYVQPLPPAYEPLNFNSRNVSHANVLNASLAAGGKGLNGEGIVIGIGDESDIQTNYDFAARLIDRNFNDGSRSHAYHTAGTAAGAGIINELYRGYAPKATIVTNSFDYIIYNAPAYVTDYGMVITSNSYGSVVGCTYNGLYDLSSSFLDQLSIDYPNLQNVFAAGNSGNLTCTPFATGFHTVLGGFQSSKNAIMVGNASDSANISNGSSRGPVKDGRIKPEITAMGTAVYSDYLSNSYGYLGGTSQAAPAVAGGMALLYQRYRQLNGGANPSNALMKAIMVNGATDKGNPGPDYVYGFGFMNLLRSVDMLENHHYFNGTATSSSLQQTTISVPANTASLKVMICWNDPAASPLAAQTLVNDLDLEVSDPSSTINYPQILDTSKNGLALNATTGPDHVNNIEQVVINNPASGNYTISVKGTAINQNPSQDYYVVYDVVPVALQLASPAGGERLVPSTSNLNVEKITWDANGLSAGTADLEFSADNGLTWSPIATGLDIRRGIYTWAVPDTVTTQARVRITKNGSGETSISNPFTIIGVPNVQLDAVQCEGYININWPSVKGALSYDIMKLDGDSMRVISNTTANNYSFSGLSKDSTYVVAVRARTGSDFGLRSVAVIRQPSTGTCAGSISDNDLAAQAILAPASGRKYTATELGNNPVTVRIKNLDDQPVTGFQVAYRVNGSAWVTENVSATISAGSTYTHNFVTPFNFSAVGNYALEVAVTNSTSDPVSANDTIRTLIRQLDNVPLNLTTPFLDDLESTTAATYQKDTLGIAGDDRFDFVPSAIYGRLRSFVNSGIAHSGSKAFTLDLSRFYAPGSTNYLTGTYNLTNYNVVNDDVRLDFQMNSHGTINRAANRLWIRGADSQPWILAYDLDAKKADPGVYKKTESIEVAHLLRAAGQTLTPSFQVRWGQAGQYQVTDPFSAEGFTFDDIRFYLALNDMQLTSIDAPASSSCTLSASTVITITVKNSSNNVLNSVPVRYRVNNGAWVSETIASVPAGSSFQYSFTTPFNFSAFGNYQLQAIVDLPSDNFRENDTALVRITNLPKITSFPYLQNFEADAGYWYTDGKNSSWQYGTPSSIKIKRAASGAKAWKTNLTGSYNNMEESYLYSPCFDISTLSYPHLSFSFALDVEDGGSALYDAGWLEYSSDGVTWTKLGANGSGTNWYNQPVYQLWSKQDYARWHVATIALPSGLNQMRLRFVMHSDGATTFDGLGIDDIHIYDSTASIYNGTTMAAPVTQTISAPGKTDFKVGQQLLASLISGGPVLGTTAAQVYINTGTVRNTGFQYYHDRNLTLKPANRNLSDSVTVRFYFLDSETEALIAATGCTQCTKPASAYELGVTKYTDTDTSKENGTLADNAQNNYKFIRPDQITMVPFDKGYYAEFRVINFSEFWLNNGYLNQATPLPVKLVDFTATKSQNDALLHWLVATEFNVSHYEIEVARGKEELQAGRFHLIGSVQATALAGGLKNYDFKDSDPSKSGMYYYRLKWIDKDGNFSFSAIRPVSFEEASVWSVFPNPSDGRFQLIFQSNQELFARVLDVNGRTVKSYTVKATGSEQKLEIDLRGSGFANGVYLLQLSSGNHEQSIKLYKN